MHLIQGQKPEFISVILSMPQYISHKILIHSEFHCHPDSEDKILHLEHLSCKHFLLRWRAAIAETVSVPATAACCDRTVLFHPHSDSIMERVLFVPVCRWGNRGSESLHNMPAHTALSVKWDTNLEPGLFAVFLYFCPFALCWKCPLAIIMAAKGVCPRAMYVTWDFSDYINVCMIFAQESCNIIQY